MTTRITKAVLATGAAVTALVGMTAAEQGTAPAPAPAAQATSAVDVSTRVPWADVVEAAVDARVVTDASLAEAIRATGLPWRVRDKATGIEMLLVPPGSFSMGMSVGDDYANGDERPAHEVIITKPFYLGRTEVTQAQWSKVMGSNPSYFQDVNFKPMTNEEREATLQKMVAAGFTRQQAESKLGPPVIAPISTANWPVETLTWDDVQLFQERTGLRPPTEAEWEYACRAGTTEPLYGRLEQIAWTTVNGQERTHPVGAKLPNALGFYDMIGNAWEWTNDWYAADYYKACEFGATDPRGPGSNNFRVLRGGSWDYDERSCRASFRLNYFLGDPRITDFGLRAARTP